MQQIEQNTGEILKLTPAGKISRAKPYKSKLSLEQHQQRLANRSSNYWAKMRTTNQLLHKVDQEKSPHIDQVIDDFRKELGDILDSGILSYPHTLQQIGLTQNDTLEERKIKLGIKKSQFTRTENEQKFMDDMIFKAHNIRKTNWAWRIAEEAEEKHRLGWHPFFVTLTIAPEKAYEAGTTPKEIWTEGKEFRRYITDLCNVVTDELKHERCNKPPYNPQRNYVTYAAVIEHGKSRKHHHCHIIVWLRAIPPHWRICPNKGIKNPENRVHNECIPMRALWKWSRRDLSPPKYFRYVGDIWEKSYNFSLPWDEKNDKPLSVSTVRTAGLYITKYLAKEFKEWHHRMKATRNLGLNRINQWFSKISLETAIALTWRAESSSLNHSLTRTHTVPLGLVRSLAKRRVFLIKFTQNQLDMTDVLKSNLGIFTRMLRSVRSGQRPDRMDSSEFFDWLGKLLPGEKGYCKYKQMAAHVALSSEFPRPRKKVKQHTKIGANKSGNIK